MKKEMTMSFQGKYTGHQGAYRCNQDGSKHTWWLSAMMDERCNVLFYQGTSGGGRTSMMTADAEDKCFKPDKLVVPMEYLT